MTALLTTVTATHVERLSPSYVRVELGSPTLADFGVDGPLFDQRIKLLFPGPTGRLPELGQETWWADFLAIPEDERGHVRTYTIREVRGSGADTRLVVDFVLHPGAHGPGSAWAGDATPGDRIMVLCPRRGEGFGGIEFDPGDAQRLMIVGDETALPAIASILAWLPADAVGAAFIEVPEPGDVQPLTGPEGVAVNWLPRGGAAHGERLGAAVLAHFGEHRQDFATTDVPDDHVDPDLWETPAYSSSGESLEGGDTTHHGLYAWIAGESRAVTALRRRLVNDLGIDRRQVAFMGYWREGVAMRS